MKAIHDPHGALASGLAAIRQQYQVPEDFPREVLAAADLAARNLPGPAHEDRTDEPFVTLDPASSTDLDQAFHIEEAGNDLLLHYAIADVAWFVADGDPLDVEAWKRGETLYLPDGKAGLYPPALAEGAASLLPQGPRPAVVFTVRLGPDGEARLDAARRALIRSRAKLAYDSVTAADLPPAFARFAERVNAAEAARGAARVDPPEQEVEALGDGRYALSFRPLLASERRNAALSLAANLAIAAALQQAGTGLFRVMAGPSAKAMARLRSTAAGLGLAWPEGVDLKALERTLDQRNPAHAAFMLAVRRAGTGAGYAPWIPGVTPWHEAIAATYAHATAPLRRLADRYVIRATLAVANGQPVDPQVEDAFRRLPGVMAKAEALSGQIERAVIDLAETVMLHGREGETFKACVTDADGDSARVQLLGLPIVSRARIPGAAPGSRVDLRLAAVDSKARRLTFAPA
ncbi:RNB domain-containing ribonuclease [Novosphingobium taihuense]|uniref:Exoribonuclease R n=1 Tax=Novosphingobium taihuense TaxID=260085 RepID=A0A7W7AAR3_9SPHN|nr:RNB domain-containing ribonuclease [Novosphingobium taihuense]MBB4612795.1 exoribonuclease R [Novosphingobium taihuense]TWH80294.1 exoribonuclease R [Novosphingobium taihuense]